MTAQPDRLVRGPEAPTLGQRAAEPGDERKSEQGEGEEDTPAAPAPEIGDGEGEECGPGPERTDDGQQAHGIGPGSSGHLLGGEDRDEDQSAGEEASAHDLEGDEHLEVGGDGGECVEDASRRYGRQRHRPSATTIGQCHHEQRNHEVSSGGGESEALGRGGEAEFFASEFDRLTQEHPGVGSHRGEGAEGTQHGRGPKVHRLGRRPPGVPAGRTEASQHPAVRQRQHPPQEREDESVLDGLNHIGLVGAGYRRGLDLTAVTLDRSVDRREGAAAARLLDHETVTGDQDLRQALLRDTSRRGEPRQSGGECTARPAPDRDTAMADKAMAAARG